MILELKENNDTVHCPSFTSRCSWIVLLKPPITSASEPDIEPDSSIIKHT